MALISSLKCLLWLALIIWCSAFWIKTMSSWFLSQWAFLFGSFFCVGLPLLQDLSIFFLVQQHITNNNVQLGPAWDLPFSISKYIINKKKLIVLIFASLFNSTSSFSDPMLQFLFDPSASTCHKNDRPWNQWLSDFSFAESSLYEASLSGLFLLET